MLLFCKVTQLCHRKLEKYNNRANNALSCWKTMLVLEYFIQTYWFQCVVILKGRIYINVYLVFNTFLIITVSVSQLLQEGSQRAKMADFEEPLSDEEKVWG